MPQPAEDRERPGTVARSAHPGGSPHAAMPVDASGGPGRLPGSIGASGAPSGAHTSFRGSPPSTAASGIWDGNLDCPRILVDLNTHAEPASLHPISFGSFDFKWSIIHDETAWTVEPRPAKVVQRYYLWRQAQVGTRWLSALDAQNAILANTVVFQTEFGISGTETQDVWFELGAKATFEV